MEASVSRGYGTKNCVCIEGFNAGNNCVKHIWQEADKDDPNFEATIYQMYLMYLSLITDTTKRWNFFSFEYEEKYVPVCLGGKKAIHYTIYESGNQAVCPTELDNPSGTSVPERRPSRAERKRARRANYQKYMADLKARRAR